MNPTHLTLPFGLVLFVYLFFLFFVFLFLGGGGAGWAVIPHNEGQAYLSADQYSPKVLRQTEQR